MIVILRAVFYLGLALALWYLLTRFYQRLEPAHAVSDLPPLLSLLPAGLFLLMSFALRSAWWMALAASLALAALLGLLLLLADSLSRLLREHWPSAENRARRRGSLRERLELYSRAGKQAEALALIEDSIAYPPFEPLKVQLLWTASELFALRASAAIARGAGVPAAIVDRILQDADAAGRALWGAVESAAAAAAQGVHGGAVTEAMQAEVARVQRLDAAIREAREGLARVTLSGSGRESDLAGAERALRTVAEAARDLAEEIP